MESFSSQYAGMRSGGGMPCDSRYRTPATAQFQMTLANLNSQLFNVITRMMAPEVTDIVRHNLHHQRTAILNQIDEVIDQQTAFWKSNIAQPSGPVFRTAEHKPAWASAQPYTHAWTQSPNVNPRWDPNVIDTSAREVK